MNAVLRQIPNMLSALRLMLAPVAAWLILHERDLPALVVFLIAGASDAADGFLAKRYGLASRFGAWLDPAADKLLMLASFLTLTYVGAVPWQLTVLVIGRDLAIVAGVLAAQMFKLPLEVKPLAVGKVSTVVQVGYIALVLLLLTVHELTAHQPPPVIAEIGVMLVAALAIMSLLAYAQLWFRAVFARRDAA